jgi:outer membrane protein
MSEILLLTLMVLPPAPTKVLTLGEALSIAARSQPNLRQAKDATDVAKARADEARAPLLPQVNGTATYQRTTSNCVTRPGSPVCNAMSAVASQLDSFNFWAFGLTTSQLVYDSGVTIERFRAAQATAEAQAATELATRLQTDLSVRTAFFNARAQKALIQVQKETLENQDRHLSQIEGFVRVGTRPEIDLAQARTDRANALVALITAQNGYDVARAQLGQAIGLDAPPDFDLSDEVFPPVSDEDATMQQLLDEAWRGRPEVVAADKQLRAAQLTVRSAYGSYGPSLGVGTSVTDSGTALGSLGWNANFSVSLSWNLFSGLLNWSQVREAKATYDSFEAQRDLIKLGLRLEVDQGRVAVSGAKAALTAATEALENARVRLKLAEGRYQAGVGSVIELGDAQVALTNAAAQEVQARYTLANARAQLMKALGRR